MNIKKLLTLSNLQINVIFFTSIFVTLLVIPFDSLYFFIKRNPTLVFLSATSYIALLSFRSQRHLARAKNTIDFQTLFHGSEDMKKATKVYVKKIALMTTDELIEMARTDRPAKTNKAVREILNSWERVAVAVRYDVYDEELLYKIYATFLLKSWTTLSPYIKEKQRANPRVYVQLQWLALRWRVRREEFDFSEERKKVRDELKKLRRNPD